MTTFGELTSPSSQRDRYCATFNPEFGVTIHLSTTPGEPSGVHLDSNVTSNIAGLNEDAERDGTVYFDISADVINRWFRESPAFTPTSAKEWRRRVVTPVRLLERIFRDYDIELVRRMIIHRNLRWVNSLRETVERISNLIHEYEAATLELENARRILKPIEEAYKTARHKFDDASHRHSAAESNVAHINETYMTLEKQRLYLQELIQSS